MVPLSIDAAYACEHNCAAMRSRVWAIVALAALAVVVGIATIVMLGRPVPSPDPITVVQAWTAARNAGNVDAALALLAEDADVLDHKISERDARSALRGVLEAQAIAGWRVEDRDCAVNGPSVKCRYSMHDALLRKCSLAFAGTHEYRVDGGKLRNATRQHDAASRSDVYGALLRFRGWVQKNHPDALDVIWVSRFDASYTTPDGARTVMSFLNEYPCLP
jgi:hypothetical protein